ncbi:MAG: hypothetical protein ACI4MJ_09410 [Aristaeellaceae bacterium]
MKKRLMLAVTLLLCVALLCGCQSKSGNTRYTPVTTSQTQANAYATQHVVMAPTAEPTLTIDYDSDSSDPIAEESMDDVYVPEEVVVTVAPTMTSEYAGATPVIIDPIDKPTPSPVPPLTFTYQVYDATNIRLSFEAPAGWIIETPSTNSFMLVNPDTSVNYAASITITASSVSSNYSSNDLKQVINDMLDSIGESGFNSYSPSKTASRALLDSTGVYANYSGTLDGGVEVAGRVHATCVNKVLYTLHVSYPKAYTETYKDKVYDHLRDTIMISQ